MNDSLTIFFPCYNDAATIGSLVMAADVVAGEYTSDYEIIVVNDGSSDNSLEILSALKEKYPRLRVISHERNLGYGAALQTGFSNAAKELIFYTDGDGQYDVFELRGLLAGMRNDVDVVNGYKISRTDPFYRVIAGKMYLLATKLLFNFRVRDIDCDFRLIRRSATQTIQLRHTSGVICLELVKKLELAGYKFGEVAIHHYSRRYGNSQFFRPYRLLVTCLNVLRLWWELIILRDTPINVACRRDSVNSTIEY